MDGIEESSGRGGVKLFLLALPVCLVVSIIGAIWFHWHLETKEVADPGLAMGGEGIEREEVEDLVKKFDWLGELPWDVGAEARKKFRGTISFVSGSWSPQNYGFIVHRGGEVSHEDELWPMVWVDVEGTEQPKEVVLVVAPYDFGNDSLISLMTAARELRDAKVERTIRFLVYPEQLFMENERRSDMMKPGEKIVALLRLRQMGEPVEGGGAMLSLNGPSLGELEGHVPIVGIDRGIRPVNEEDYITQRAFGREGAGLYQMVRPVGSETWPKKKGDDLDALIARTRVLVELISALAGEE